ncbi:MAG: cereblon family protein [Terasakiella sp.]|uniref:cereblon family protein n=1 Tax=unclassified Terasakiella TaxID=2614952 RepID=UPI003B008B09
MPFDAQHKASHENQLETDKEKLFCAACGHLITFADQHIVMKGDHEHTVFNPAGIIFTIGCFQDAPGCLTTGQKSTEFSWFPGYKWQLAHCSHCQRHLGWMFCNPSQIPAYFFGLIRNRLSKKN